MEINNSVITNKVNDIISALKSNPTALAKKAGIDPANFRRKLQGQQNFTKTDVIKLANALDLTTLWFGNEESLSFYEIHKDRILKKARYINGSSSSKPFYDLDFSCIINNDTHPSSYIEVPWCDDIDFWVRANGDSMSPKIENGDVIGLKEIKDWDKFLVMGEIYAIVTVNGFKAIRIIDASTQSNHFSLRAKSDKTSQDIDKSTITKVYKVCGIIKIM